MTAFAMEMSNVTYEEANSIFLPSDLQSWLLYIERNSTFAVNRGIGSRGCCQIAQCWYPKPYLLQFALARVFSSSRILPFLWTPLKHSRGASSITHLSDPSTDAPCRAISSVSRCLAENSKAPTE